jgi:L-lactate dehydrogenase complex protein LldG
VCSDFSLRLLAVPMVPMQWRPDGVEIVEDAGLTASELDDFDGALTGCAAAIAQTGTILLDGRGVSGRRPLTLIPEHHICVIETDQIVGIVPEAFRVSRRRRPTSGCR